MSAISLTVPAARRHANIGVGSVNRYGLQQMEQVQMDVSGSLFDIRGFDFKIEISP